MLLREKTDLVLHVTRCGEAAVLHVSGSADMVQAEKLRRQLRLLDSERPAAIVLELGGLEFIMPRALAAIVEAFGLARRRGGRFRLVSPAGDVRSVFDRAGLDRLLPIHDTLADALAV